MRKSNKAFPAALAAEVGLEVEGNGGTLRVPSGMKKKSVVDHYVYLTPHPIFFHPGPPANAGV